MKAIAILFVAMTAVAAHANTNIEHLVEAYQSQQSGQVQDAAHSFISANLPEVCFDNGECV